MPRQNRPVTSTCLSDVSYDSDTAELTLTFKQDGSVYTYSSVQEWEVDKLVEAGSVGAHFNYNVRSEFPFRRR